MKEYIKNHYLPKSYLKNWKTNNSNIYELINDDVKITHYKNKTYEKRLYDFSKIGEWYREEIKDVKDTELELKKYEDEFLSIRDRIIDNNIQLNDINILINIMFLTLIRNINTLNTINKYCKIEINYNNFKKKYIQHYLSSCDNLNVKEILNIHKKSKSEKDFLNNIEKIYGNGDLYKKISNIFNDCETQKMFLVKLIYNIIKNNFLDDRLKIVYTKNINIYYKDINTNNNFITSNNPLVVLNDSGFLNSAIIFPLSHNVVISISCNLEQSKKIPFENINNIHKYRVGDDDIKRINKKLLNKYKEKNSIMIFSKDEISLKNIL